MHIWLSEKLYEKPKEAIAQSEQAGHCHPRSWLRGKPPNDDEK